MQAKKPVIYLYPKETQSVSVQLDHQWTLIADYPKYDKKIKWWRVKAHPDGTLIDETDGEEYSYLFWEWQPSKEIDWDMPEGFVVKWEDTREFLRDKLTELWLTPREYNEFIVYWYPKMKDNPYNLIHFAGTQYTDLAPLTITPEPDALLRVFMVYRPLTENMTIPEQKLSPFTRTGFTVVEWGGNELK